MCCICKLQGAKVALRVIGWLAREIWLAVSRKKVALIKKVTCIGTILWHDIKLAELAFGRSSLLVGPMLCMHSR